MNVKEKSEKEILNINCVHSLKKKTSSKGSAEVDVSLVKYAFNLIR